LLPDLLFNKNPCNYCGYKWLDFSKLIQSSKSSLFKNMSSYTRGKKREVVIFVAVNEIMRFGWKPKDLSSITGISATDLADLGHTRQEALTGTGLILVVGCQKPKPPRVTRKIATASVTQQQSVSTFCAYDKLATAVGKNWNLSKNRSSVTLRAPSSNRRSVTAIASLSDNSLYCFPMNQADFDSYAAELGLENATTISSSERNRLVSGSSKPRPGRASKQLADGSFFSSFFSTSLSQQVSSAGYDILEEELVLKLGSSDPTP
jgi:hypothetical protein